MAGVGKPYALNHVSHFPDMWNRGIITRVEMKDKVSIRTKRARTVPSTRELSDMAALRGGMP
jgi:hypothetical protein